MSNNGELQSDPWPRRYDIVDGLYVERPLWTNTAGKKFHINPEWQKAEHEWIVERDSSGKLARCELVNRMEEIRKRVCAA